MKQEANHVIATVT